MESSQKPSGNYKAEEQVATQRPKVSRTQQAMTNPKGMRHHPRQGLPVSLNRCIVTTCVKADKGLGGTSLHGEQERQMKVTPILCEEEGH